jgi:hypothetical protein
VFKGLREDLAAPAASPSRVAAMRIKTYRMKFVFGNGRTYEEELKAAAVGSEIVLVKPRMSAEVRAMPAAPRKTLRRPILVAFWPAPIARLRPAPATGSQEHVQQRGAGHGDVSAEFDFARIPGRVFDPYTGGCPTNVGNGTVAISAAR